MRQMEIDDRIHLPDEHTEFVGRFGELVPAIQEVLGEERKYLGGDGYALPFFVLGVALHLTLTSMALGEPADDGLSLISDALMDLGVHAEEAKLDELLRLETEWIQTRGTEVDADDIRMAWARMAHQLLERWLEGERRTGMDLPEISLDDVPLYSCFISYNRHDEAFCTQLYDTLRLRGVRVWYAPDRMMAGDQIANQLDRGLETHDKLVLVLSETSIRSEWVRYEIMTALSLSGDQGEEVLVPISLMDPARLKGWDLRDPETNRNLAEYIRGMLIPDFSDWGVSERFEKGFEQLYRALRRLKMKRRRHEVSA